MADMPAVSSGSVRRYLCCMHDDDLKPAPGSTADPAGDNETITADARRGRKFDVQALVGREAAGTLKGASPVPAAQQALLVVGALLEARLPDSEGSLTRTLLARLADEPALLGRHLGHPEAALAELLERILSAPAGLTELVRQADARWGRDYDERPRFEREGQPPAADDPYTEEQVRNLLAELRRGL